jgi:hypothetical protein
MLTSFIMSDIFLPTNSTISAAQRPPRPGHGNNCHGHNTAIANGSYGHSYNDGCGCDDLNPETSIDFIMTLLAISAILLMLRSKLTQLISN